MLSIYCGNRLDSVERVEAGEEIDSSERQWILRLSSNRRKESGDVAQLVRALPCHGRGRGFEPRRPRQIPKDLSPFWHVTSRYKKVQVKNLSLNWKIGRRVEYNNRLRGRALFCFYDHNRPMGCCSEWRTLGRLN